MRYRERLEVESTSWVEAGVISAEQRTGILDRVERDSVAGRAAVVLGAFAAALLAGGVSLTVAANWDVLDRLERVGIAAALTLLVQVVGAFAASRGRPRLGHALVTAGAAGATSTLALISQQYHVPVSLAVLFAAGAVVAIGIAAAMSMQWPLAVAALSIVAALVADAATAEESHLGLSSTETFAALLAVGVGLVASAGCLRGLRLARFATPLEAIGFPLVVVALVPLGLEDFLVEIDGDEGFDPGLPMAAAVLVGFLALIAAGALVLAWRAGGDARIPLATLAASGLALALMPLALRFAYDDPLRVAWAFRGFGALAAAGAVWVGLAVRRPVVVAAGVVLAASLLIARYVANLDEVGLTGIAFVVGGVVLVASTVVAERVASRRRSP